MKNNRNIKNQSGIIQTLVLIIIGLIILGYFKINIKDVLTNPIVEDNLQYAWQLVVWGYTNLAHLLAAHF